MTNNPYQNIIVVGCGGVGSWLAHLLVRLLPKLNQVPVLHLMDGDLLEEKNLDRQVFNAADIGKAKAQALTDHLKVLAKDLVIKAHVQFFHGRMELPPATLIFCCVDNHPGRAYVLEACDLYRAHAILAANEITGAEAYLYRHDWLRTPKDPRSYYPEILSDESNDPTHQASCVELAQDSTPQLALANYMAAGQAAYLFWFLMTEAHQLTGEDEALWPVHHKNSLYRFMSERAEEKQPQPERKESNGNTSHDTATTDGEPAGHWH